MMHPGKQRGSGQENSGGAGGSLGTGRQSAASLGKQDSCSCT